MKKKSIILLLVCGLCMTVSAGIVKPVSVTGSIAGDAGSSDQWLLNDNSGFADPTLQRPAGTEATLETGDSLADALATLHARSASAHAESWTRSINYGNPVFVFDLTGGGDISVGSVILWQYGNNGGTATNDGGNSTREFELIFHTETEGAAFDLASETVEFSGVMDPILGNDTIDNIAQFFGFGSEVDARYIALRIASNYAPPADSNITIGGDRYGLGEVRFATETVVPEPATFGLLALGGLSLIRRKKA